MALKFRHAGQACITANRVYIQRAIYPRLAELLTAKAAALKLGHGTDPSTTMGPVTVPQSLDKIAEQIADAEGLGGKVLTGGKKADLGGYFFEPTVIGDCGPNMKVAREETFAPLLALFPFDTEEEAVEMANDTSVGSPLGSFGLFAPLEGQNLDVLCWLTMFCDTLDRWVSPLTPLLRTSTACGASLRTCTSSRQMSLSHRPLTRCQT